MTGGDKRGADAVGVVEELAEFEPVVALHARIGRAAASVFVDEVVDDLAEFGLQVEGIERNVQPVGDAAGIFGIAGRAAALLMVSPLIEYRQPETRLAIDGTRLLGFLAVPHEYADDFMPGLFEQPGGDARINAAGHS